MKTVRKFNRADAYDVDGFQRWLEEMAGQGLHLKRWGGRRSQFRRGEPKKVRYRLEPARAGTLSQQAKEEYGEMGWHYVCGVGESFHIFRADDAEAPELFTDPESHALAMKRLAKKVRGELVWDGVLLLATLIAVRQFWGGGISAEAVTENLSLFNSVVWLVYIPYVCYGIYHDVCLLRTYRALNGGKTMPRSPRWHRTLAVLQSTYGPLMLGLLLLSLGDETYQALTDDYRSLRDVPISVPSLVELETLPDFALDEFREGYGYGFHPEEGTYARPESSLLAPVQYAVVQTGWDNTVFWKDLLPGYPYNMRYNPSLSIELWETRWASLARTVLDAELEPAQRQYDQVQELEVEGFDMALLYQDGESSGSRLFLLKGNRAAAVRYHGAQNFEEHLDHFYQLMEADWTLP